MQPITEGFPFGLSQLSPPDPLPEAPKAAATFAADAEASMATFSAGTNVSMATYRSGNYFDGKQTLQAMVGANK